jgi:hypothetical protein
VVVTELREACARVAAEARQVRIDTAQIPRYLTSLPVPPPAQAPLLGDAAERSRVAWYWLTLDAINFGSGWFPTLHKRPGATGYATVASGLRRRFDAAGPWSASELTALGAADLATLLEQDAGHPLMALFATSLNDLGTRLETDHRGDPLRLIDAARGSAPELVERLAGWDCFRDVSRYDGFAVPFNKRSQIAAADLARSGAAALGDLDRLTMFADNLVPHVLRLDGILEFAPELVARIDAEALIEPGSSEEVEIRACAVTAVELIVAGWVGHGGEAVSAAQVDELLWQRGQRRRYKASPRHRSRSTAY